MTRAITAERAAKISENLHLYEEMFTRAVEESGGAGYWAGIWAGKYHATMEVLQILGIPVGEVIDGERVVAYRVGEDIVEYVKPEK